MKFNMEQCFRIALWMCLLICYLQAFPLCFFKSDLKLNNLRDNVTCSNVTFKSTANVPENCYHEAHKLFKDELEKALDFCKDEYDYISPALEALDNVTLTGSDCSLETTETDFKTFLGNLTDFVDKVNSNNKPNICKYQNKE